MSHHNLEKEELCLLPSVLMPPAWSSLSHAVTSPIPPLSSSPDIYLVPLQLFYEKRVAFCATAAPGPWPGPTLVSISGVNAIVCPACVLMWFCSSLFCSTSLGPISDSISQAENKDVNALSTLSLVVCVVLYQTVTMTWAADDVGSSPTVKASVSAQSALYTKTLVLIQSLGGRSADSSMCSLCVCAIENH